VKIRRRQNLIAALQGQDASISSSRLYRRDAASHHATFGLNQSKSIRFRLQASLSQSSSALYLPGSRGKPLTWEAQGFSLAKPAMALSPWLIQQSSEIKINVYRTIEQQRLFKYFKSIH